MNDITVKVKANDNIVMSDEQASKVRKFIENTIIPYDEIDKEIVELCRALNSIDGIETIESCCGHGKEKCRIYFTINNINLLNRLCFHCFNHEDFWKIRVDTGDPNRRSNKLHFVLTSRRICKQKDFDELTDRINERKEDMKLSDEEWEKRRYADNREKVVTEVLSKENHTRFYVC